MKNLFNINLFSFCILLFLSSKLVKPQKYLKLPLSIISFPNEQELSSISIDLLLVKLSKSRLQTNITIGSNKQVLPTDISFNHYPLYVSSILCEENIIKFNQDSSTTFKNFDKIDGYNLNQNCLRCNTSKDFFYFPDNNNNKNENNNNKGIPLFFVLGSILTTESKSVSAEIGFRPTKPKRDPSVLNLIVQLKKANAISNKNFMFKLNVKEKKGDLLLGAYGAQFYHNYEKFKYFYVSAENGNIQEWEFLLDNAYYGNKYICEKNKVVLSLNQYFIYVPFYMKKILDEEFFGKLYENKKCDLINLNKTSTYFYVCDDNIDITKMKNFKFFPTNLNEPIEFVLSPEDLFLKYEKNKLLYIIAFNYDVDYWKFNLPFIMKYQPIFDIENKIIAFYNDLSLFDESDFYQEQNNNNNGNNNNNNNKNNKSKNNEMKDKEGNNFFKIFFIIFLCLFLILILFILIRKAIFYFRKEKYKEKNDPQLLEFRDMSEQNNEDSKDKNNSSENKLVN